MRPQVLLVFQTRFEECTAMLRGIAHFERSHQLWTGFLDDEARAEDDPLWLRDKRWDGIISRHTTETLVTTCASLGLPLVDLNDTEPFPGVPKIRPDNAALGHLGAEHFLERGYRHFGFSGFSNNGWSEERRDGFIEALRLAGRTCALLDVVYPGNYTPFWDSQQAEVIVRWLQQLPKPVGIMACNDLRAQQVINAPRRRLARPRGSGGPWRQQRTHPLRTGLPAALQRQPQCLPIRLPGGGGVDGIDGRQGPGIDGHADRPGGGGDAPLHRRPGHRRPDRDQGAELHPPARVRRLTVSEVVAAAHTCRSQLEKKFRKHLGRSPQEEIRRVQIAKLKQLLAETDYPRYRAVLPKYTAVKPEQSRSWRSPTCAPGRT